MNLEIIDKYYKITKAQQRIQAIKTAHLPNSGQPIKTTVLRFKNNDKYIK
jgi:hypothetical protein